MRILFHTYNVAFQNNEGGIQKRVSIMAKKIRARGYDVSYFNPSSTKLKDYDILHLFKLDCENFALVQYAKTLGLRIVISSVVPLSGRWKLTLLRWFSFFPVLTTFRMMKTQLELSDAIVVESNQEKDFLIKFYGVTKNKIKVIPNGIDYDDYQGDDFAEYTGYNGKYALCVGRFDQNKNQLRLIQAMKGTDIELFFIGGAGIGAEEYYNQCLAEADNCGNIHFLGWHASDSNLLRSAFSNCHLLILPSLKETFGLTLLEASIHGARVVMSEGLPILDYKVFNDSACFNPYSVSDIRDKVYCEYRKTKEEAFAKKVYTVFNWNNVIDQYLELYEE